MENTGIPQQDQDLLASPTQNPHSLGLGAGTGTVEATTLIQFQNLEQIINDITKINLARVQGLRYFNGGKEWYEENPELLCEKSVSQWIEDLEARTRMNWTDEARIQLANQYTLGSAGNVILSAILAHGYCWEAVKDKLREIYPEKDFVEHRVELRNAKRKSGETISEFYIRMDLLMQTMIKMDPDCTPYVKGDLIMVFLEAFPPEFNNFIPTHEKNDPVKVYHLALQFVRNHPHYKLTDADIRREVRQTENMAMGTRQTDESPFRCYNCQGIGHMARRCKKRGPRCQNCGMNNHRTNECRKAP